MTEFLKQTITKNYNLYYKGILTGLVIAGLVLIYFTMIEWLIY